ncbi:MULTISPECIES: GTPase Era [Gammaproteobacteria]|uniref:GTPase Era n=1 Tax=Gammaproteobacteria TaxID=1236 RepID=UPI000DD03EA3|nr:MULTISPECIES: GTPase Era [Gammaproteobacteria]RTE87109.1 GTPase Era [Aliidiomarina sp. B3213]TCZ93103.1 GTPase Era [Lysobacter sp. N42]
MTEQEKTYNGFIAIVGRPNVGKSTLLNQLLGQKISITSKKAQTTRHRIIGIDTEGPYQTVYVDTPGLHQDEKRAINRLMNRAASSSIGDVELALFVVEGTKWTSDDEMVLEKLQQAKRPVALIINKIDQIKKKDELLPHIAALSKRFDFVDILPMSAKTPDHIPQLKAIVRRFLREGMHFFPEDYVTDRSVRFMVAETVREKLMRYTGDELPYSTTVEIEKFNEQASGVILIHALILVEREGQKRMVIGNKGSKLKMVGQDARRDIERLLQNQVNLQLWVKVKSGWADDERALRSLGYGEE